MAEITTRKRERAYLALATGRVFKGWAFGAAPKKDGSIGEVVFNTSLSGYQEILTDPSYQGQIVVMTPSHIGNYGVTPEDAEGRRVFLSGFVVQEESAVYSNWRATESMHDYLKKAGIPGVSGVDTRAITRVLRAEGAVNGLISLDGRDLDALVKRAKKAPGLENRDLTAEVTGGKTYQWTEGSIDLARSAQGQIPRSHGNAESSPSRTASKKKVVVMDFGVKENILRCLVDEGCEVTVVPANADAADIIDKNPDGVLLSNGPGDPAAVKKGVATIQKLIDHNLKQKSSGKKPFAMFGICLGHQLLGLALGGTTYKLKFGHHGANHPIKDLETGRVDITTQNHGFCVAGEEVKGKWYVKGNRDAVVTHINLNDQAIEGLRHTKIPLFSVQYHPEASSGPHDARHLFDRFLTQMEDK